VKDLQDRVYTLTLVIIDTVPANGDASTELQGRIKDLKSWVPSVVSDILVTILTDASVFSTVSSQI
jgi:hypothetical protein